MSDLNDPDRVDMAVLRADSAQSGEAISEEDQAFAGASRAKDAERVDRLDRGSDQRRGRGRGRGRGRDGILLVSADHEASKAAIRLRDREQDVGLKRFLAIFAVVAVGVQLAVADLIFGWYVMRSGVHPSETVMVAWLSSTVVEIIGIVAIVAIVARNLFPNKRRRAKTARDDD